MEDKVVLCSASFYKQNYYFNEEYNKIPEQIRKELRVIAVCLAEKVRGISMLGFYKDNGDFFVEVSGDDDDFTYDEIGARLEANAAAKDNSELFRALSLWYQAFVLGKVDICK